MHFQTINQRILIHKINTYKMNKKTEKKKDNRKIEGPMSNVLQNRWLNKLQTDERKIKFKEKKDFPTGKETGSWVSNLSVHDTGPIHMHIYKANGIKYTLFRNELEINYFMYTTLVYDDRIKMDWIDMVILPCAYKPKMHEHQIDNVLLRRLFLLFLLFCLCAFHSFE